MTDRLKRLCDEIRALEPVEQAQVLDLLRDQGAMPEPSIEDAWMAEACRRARAMTDEVAEAAAEVPTQGSRDAVNAYVKR